MRVLRQWLVLWKGLRLLAQVFCRWRYRRRTPSRRRALHLNHRAPTLPSSANMPLNHRCFPTLRKRTKDRTPLSLQHPLSPLQTLRNPYTPHRLRKLQRRTQNKMSTSAGLSSWPTTLLRSRADALLETLYRSPRMPTSLSLHLPPLYQP